MQFGKLMLHQCHDSGCFSIALLLIFFQWNITCSGNMQLTIMQIQMFLHVINAIYLVDACMLTIFPARWYFKSRVNFSQSLFRNLKIISIWYRMENSICLGSQDELLHILWFTWCGGQSQPRKWGQQHLRTHSRVFCFNFQCPHDRAQNKRCYMNWRNFSSIFLHCFLRCTKS